MTLTAGGYQRHNCRSALASSGDIPSPSGEVVCSGQRAGDRTRRQPVRVASDQRSTSSSSCRQDERGYYPDIATGLRTQEFLSSCPRRLGSRSRGMGARSCGPRQCPSVGYDAVLLGRRAIDGGRTAVGPAGRPSSMQSIRPVAPEWFTDAGVPWRDRFGARNLPLRRRRRHRRRSRAALRYLRHGRARQAQTEPARAVIASVRELLESFAASAATPIPSYRRAMAAIREVRSFQRCTRLMGQPTALSQYQALAMLAACIRGGARRRAGASSRFLTISQATTSRRRLGCLASLGDFASTGVALARTRQREHCALPDWEPRWHSTRRTDVVGRAALTTFLVCVALSACQATGEPKSTVVEGKRVLLIRDSDCHGDCPAPTSIVRMGDRSYSAAASPLASTHGTGDLFATRDGNAVTHDWFEARVIPAFDPRIIVAVRYRNSHHCRAGAWFLAGRPAEPDEPDGSQALCGGVVQRWFGTPVQTLRDRRPVRLVPRRRPWISEDRTTEVAPAPVVRRVALREPRGESSFACFYL